MNVIFYILIAICVIYVGKIEKPLNVSLLCIPLAIPIGIFTALGTVIIMVLAVKAIILLAGLFVLLLSKFKAFIGAKVVAILITAGASMLGLALGPLGWTVTAICVVFFFLILISAVVDAFKELYYGFFRILAQILLKIRTLSDRARNPLPSFLKFFILIVELPIVCGLSVKGLWDLMNWVDGDISVTPLILLLRSIIIIPFIIFLYRSYLKSTSNHENENDGLDIPMPVDINGSIASHFHP